jgi:hypothetical protein
VAVSGASAPSLCQCRNGGHKKAVPGGARTPAGDLDPIPREDRIVSDIIHPSTVEIVDLATVGAAFHWFDQPKPEGFHADRVETVASALQAVLAPPRSSAAVSRWAGSGTRRGWQPFAHRRRLSLGRGRRQG